MPDMSKINQHAEVIGADGVRVGTVEHIDGKRLRLDPVAGEPDGRRYIDTGLIADIENGTVRLSANASVAILLEDED